MSVRGIGDGYAFQRLLWLLVGTVLLPTAVLSLFGVTAIRNQRAAIVQQLQEVQAADLREAAVLLLEEVDAVDARVRAAVDRCTAEPCRAEPAGVSRSWVWRRGAGPPTALPRGLPQPRGVGAATSWSTPADGEAPVGVLASTAWDLAWQVDMAHLQQVLDDSAATRFQEGADVSLRGPQRGPVGPYEELLEAWGDPLSGEVLLPHPLAQWRLTHRYAPDAPARRILGRTAWVYALVLAALVALVVAGAVITLRSAAREIRLSRLQTDFVSSVSHELRTPLTSVRMFVETLQSGRLSDPERIEECLDLLAKETDRLSRMIERVLGWARMEAGRRVYELEPVEAEELARDALQALRSQTLLDEVDIEVVLPDDLPPLRVDRDAIVEALLNLLQNAVKYTPPPQRIALSGSRRGAWVGLTVEDNGTGIAKPDRKRVFEKFYQADARLSASTHAAGERGSGLGLSIVRAVARAHGGRVELDTEVGRGSRFTLWLPAARATRYGASGPDRAPARRET